MNSKLVKYPFERVIVALVISKNYRNSLRINLLKIVSLSKCKIYINFNYCNDVIEIIMYLPKCFFFNMGIKDILVEISIRAMAVL